LIRRLAIAFGITVLALTNATTFAAAAPLTAYHVVYGGKDLGTWTSMTIAKQKGTYTSTTFDSSNGAGFQTISLARTMSAGDQPLFASLPKPNVQLVVTTLKAGKAVSVTTCPTANAWSTGTTGDPGTGTANISFACMSISTGKPAPRR
jgi:hypothetical protein